MSVPKKQVESDPDFSTDEILVTESTFQPKTQLVSLMEFLKREKASGTLILDVNRGGVTRVRFTQKQPVDVYV